MEAEELREEFPDMPVVAQSKRVRRERLPDAQPLVDVDDDIVCSLDEPPRRRLAQTQILRYSQILSDDDEPRDIALVMPEPEDGEVIDVTKRSGNWLYTFNNYPVEIRSTNWLPFTTKFHIYQCEMSSTGTPHLQGFFVLPNVMSFNALKNKLPAGVNFRQANGSVDQNIAYCSKAGGVGGPYVFGVKPPGQGRRKDLNEFFSDAKTLSDAELWTKHTHEMFKYERSVAKIRAAFAQPRNSPTENIVYVGPSGSGKTRTAFAKCLEVDPTGVFSLSAPNAPGGSIWWDGYVNHKAILVDEFYGWIPRNTLLQLCDRYPLRGQVKGGFVSLNPTKIYFTSNVHPRHWYGEHWPGSALERRFTPPLGQVIYVGNAEFPTLEDYEAGLDVDTIMGPYRQRR